MSFSKPDRTQPCEFCCFFPRRDTGHHWTQSGLSYPVKLYSVMLSSNQFDWFQGASNFIKHFAAFNSFSASPLRAATLPQTCAMTWGPKHMGCWRSQCSERKDPSHACCASLLCNDGIGWSSFIGTHWQAHTLFE